MRVLLLIRLTARTHPQAVAAVLAVVVVVVVAAADNGVVVHAAAVAADCVVLAVAVVLAAAAVAADCVLLRAAPAGPCYIAVFPLQSDGEAARAQARVLGGRNVGEEGRRGTWQ